MNGSIREYARLGLVHQMLYAEDIIDPARHTNSLLKLSRRDDIEAFDCCLPLDEQYRREIVATLPSCGKDISVMAHLSPLRKISFASPDAGEHSSVRAAMAEQVELARQIGAGAFVFASGDESGLPADKAKANFIDFCQWFCMLLAQADITPILEPFDTQIDKKFLYGPIAECIELLHVVHAVAPLCLAVDMAHVPLIGETFEHTIKSAAPHLRRVHLGNCLVKDTANPLYGDKHPPIGIEGGEHDTPQLAEFLRWLLVVGYLNKSDRNPLLMEITPFPGKSADFTVEDNFRRLDLAWKDV